jgi:hypothetical protein
VTKRKVSSSLPVLCWGLEFVYLDLGERPVPESWIDRVASEREHQAATKIQACFKGYWQHKMWKTVTQGC